MIDLLETDSPDREEYLKTIFKVLPKSYHENIALQIKEIYDSSPKEKPNEFLESIISSYSLELEESTIEEDDIPYATFTKEQILNYELNYQKLLKLEKELFQTFKWLVENKLAGIKEPKLYELYSLLSIVFFIKPILAFLFFPFFSYSIIFYIFIFRRIYK